MGVMSRRVIPACGSLCFFCPGLRARSRQPVKRYRKLLSDIFQDAEPNDRKICKLCDYTSKNPLRIPKITEYLEHKCYKDLRVENFSSAKTVLCIYKKLLSSCKEQMPLFASSLLSLVRTLLEQTRQDEMRILGCETLTEFIKCQTDSTYMFNLEGLIEKFCQLAQEAGEDERALTLRSAGLQGLAAVVWFMGAHSHISADFENIISATLENYEDLSKKSNNDMQLQLASLPQGQQPQEVRMLLALSTSVNGRIKSSELVNSNPEPTDASKSPSYWSKVCLNNMAGLAKEATTVRRVLEPLFRCFDDGNHWSPENGIARSVLSDMQSQMESSGQNSHLLLSILVKHLDHKNVVKQPSTQVHIVNVTTYLVQRANIQPSVAISGAIVDLMKQLRKCMQYSMEESNHKDETSEWNTALHSALEDCLTKLSHKFGDVGPILNMMAVVLENVPTAIISARATVAAVYRTAQIISSMPNLSNVKKAFPDALFHQLILAMTHPDPETRVWVHRLLCVVLMPSLYSTSSDTHGKPSPAVLSSTAVPQKELTSLRLSSHQVGTLLSSIWVQATTMENHPANFEAISHTYNLALLFSRSKNSSHVSLVRCFQLAFTLRSASLEQNGCLQPSCRRSLFTLASSMLIFSAKASNLPQLIPSVKETFTSKTVDPFLELIEDTRLQAVNLGSENAKTVYGSQEDEVVASQFLSQLEVDDSKLKETVISHIMNKFRTISEEELEDMKNQLFAGFSPDDTYPMESGLLMETPRPCSPLSRMVFQAFDEVMAPTSLIDEEVFVEGGSHSDRKTTPNMNAVDILSVNQLLDSVLETARQVASFPVSSTPIPYDQMKDQCEALVMGKHQKMSVLLSFKTQQPNFGNFGNGLGIENEKIMPTSQNMILDLSKSDYRLRLQNIEVQRHNQLSCASEYEQSFRLPPSSPYDKFLKAAGC